MYKDSNKKKVYNKAFYFTHQKEIKAYQKAYRQVHQEEKRAYDEDYYKAYYLVHQKEINARHKVYYITHQKEEKAYDKAHQKEIKTYQKAYRQVHQEEKRAYQKVYSKTHQQELKAYLRAYVQTSAGKKGKLRSRAKRRQFGFIPLNEYFKGAEGHHIDKQYVIYIPKELHRIISYSVQQNRNMKILNAKALEFVERGKPLKLF